MITISKITVLIVDDSAMVRKMLSMELAKDKDIEVIGAAHDPYVARDIIVEKSPDVILLDVEMPRMDGLTFLKKLMKYYPCRVIIVSSLAKKGGEVALAAMDYGALEVIAKPAASYSVADMSEQLIQKIKAVSQIPQWKVQAMAESLQDIIARSPVIKNVTESHSMLKTTQKVIAIGASTGGTEAITAVLTALPANVPPIVIVQHMPPYYTKSFADRLDGLSNIKVKEAEDNEILSAGKALIAPGNYHMEIKRSGAVYMVKLHQGPLLYHQRPAVENLFNSVANIAGKNALGIIMTGMGKDGAQGLLNMKNAGALTIAQDEKSCIVYGMPREAVELGAANKVLPLNKIPGEIIAISDT